MANINSSTQGSIIEALAPDFPGLRAAVVEAFVPTLADLSILTAYYVYLRLYLREFYQYRKLHRDRVALMYDMASTRLLVLRESIGERCFEAVAAPQRLGMACF
jgi:hypothetical protein